MCWRVNHCSPILFKEVKTKMLNFDNIEDLVAYMFDKLGDDESVSVVANKDLALSIVKELLDYNDVILKYANVDDYEYDKEYIVTLHDDINSDSWDIAIEQIYNYEKEMYFGTDGYVLFHEDVNSKVMIDMQNNENIELSGHDLFVIGEDVDSDINNEDNTGNSDPDTDDEDTDSGYIATLKVSLDTDEAEKLIRDMEKDMRRELSGMFDLLYRPYLYEYRPAPIIFF